MLDLEKRNETHLCPHSSFTQAAYHGMRWRENDALARFQ